MEHLAIKDGVYAEEGWIPFSRLIGDAPRIKLRLGS
jgi:hypothetical protein